MSITARARARRKGRSAGRRQGGAQLQHLPRRDPEAGGGGGGGENTISATDTTKKRNWPPPLLTCIRSRTATIRWAICARSISVRRIRLGRSGVTLAIIDMSLDPLLPELQNAFTLDGKRSRRSSATKLRSMAMKNRKAAGCR
jgi:hypothetical protein